MTHSPLESCTQFRLHQLWQRKLISFHLFCNRVADSSGVCSQIRPAEVPASQRYSSHWGKRLVGVRQVAAGHKKNCGSVGVWLMLFKRQVVSLQSLQRTGFFFFYARKGGELAFLLKWAFAHFQFHIFYFGFSFFCAGSVLSTSRWGLLHLPYICPTFTS